MTGIGFFQFRSVALMGDYWKYSAAADDLPVRVRSLHNLLVMLKLPAIGIQNGIAAQTTFFRHAPIRAIL